MGAEGKVLKKKSHPVLPQSVYEQACQEKIKLDDGIMTPTADVEPPTERESFPAEITTTPLSMPSTPPSDDSQQTPETPLTPTKVANTSPNARSKSISYAKTANTDGALNTHPAESSKSFPGFRVGVSEDRNRRCRRTMEDAHSFIHDYGGVQGQGFFAVFDGHAGKHAAEWCGQNFHRYLLKELAASPPSSSIPDVLNTTFHRVDDELTELAKAEKTHSGTTAVTAFLRIEDEHGQAVGSSEVQNSGLGINQIQSSSLIAGSKSQKSEGGIKKMLGRLTGSHSLTDASSNSAKPTPDHSETVSLSSTMAIADGDLENSHAGHEVQRRLEEEGDASTAAPAKKLRRILYSANVGDARAVLCRNGKAVRLTYDHKGSDQQEAKRITDAGGFVLNNRVNGVLAVTRALGDAAVKEFVVGSPYTTETLLEETDEFLIIACDGLWDVTEDEEAVNLVRGIADPQVASKILLDHALTNFSTDNLSVLVVRLTNGLGPNEKEAKPPVVSDI